MTGAGVAEAKKPGTVKVYIDSIPPRANIYLDGKDGGIQGQTGSADALKLPEGAHRLLLELDGYKALEQTVNLAKGQHLSFKLQPEPAYLDIKALATDQSSRGGEIFIDGTLAGSVPAKVEIGVGRHTIEVRRPGFLTHTEQLEIKASETRPLLVGLTAEVKVSPTTGALVINAASAAEVSVDSQMRGSAPLVVDNLAPGDHLIEVKPQDEKLKPWRRNVRVTAGQQGRVEATFAAAPPPGVAVSVIPRNTDQTYVVTLGNAQSCQTPCTLQAQPGRQLISVAGPGSKLFRQEISIPDTPSQVTVQHFTLGKSVAGAILLAYGMPSLIASSVATQSAINGGDTWAAIGYGTLAFSGASSAFSALVTMATIKLNRASVVRMGAVSSLPAPKLRFLASGVAPTPDRTGAVTTLKFAF